MARAAGGRGVARRIGADDFGQRQRARLDSRCAARLGSAMAASMIPPAHAPAFLAAHGWGDAQLSPLAGDASFSAEERRVGTECVRKCSDRWSPLHEYEKTNRRT